MQVFNPPLVMYRVEELASRPVGYQPKNRPPYKMLVSLVEILSEALGAGASTQVVGTEYNRLVGRFDSEFDILLKADPLKIAKVAGEKVAQGIKKAREGEIVINPGYDGVFGTVKIWGEKKEEEKKQVSLF